MKWIKKEEAETIPKRFDDVAQAQHLRWNIAAGTEMIYAFAAIAFCFAHGYAIFTKSGPTLVTLKMSRFGTMKCTLGRHDTPQ